MKIAITLLAMTLVATACGGGDDDGAARDDEAAIETLIRDFVAAFEDRDPDAVLGMFSSECSGLEDELTEVLEGSEFEFELTGVAIRDLEGDSAVAGPEGQVTENGEENDLSVGDLRRVVREDGEWKIGDCDFFDPGAVPALTPGLG